MMKPLFLCFVAFINFGCSNLLLDNKYVYKTPVQKGYESYFKKNKNALDPIEGIWTEYAVGILYGDNKVIKREVEPKRAIWIVIKKGNFFEVLDVNGKQYFFDASLKPTGKKDVYQFECIIHETKDRLSTSAKLIESNRLEMAYDAPKGFFNKVYESSAKDSKKDLELYWEVQWLKSPLKN